MGRALFQNQIVLRNRVKEGFDDIGIKIDPGKVTNPCWRDSALPLPVMGAGLAAPIIIVTDGNDAGPQGNVHPFEAFGITAAIPMFMMMEDHLHDVTKARDIFHHTGAGQAVTPVRSPFFDVEIGIFGKNGVRYGNHADVVKECYGFDSSHFRQGKPHLDCGADSVVGNLLAVEEESFVFMLQKLQKEGYESAGVFSCWKLQKLGYRQHSKTTFTYKIEK